VNSSADVVEVAEGVEVDLLDVAALKRRFPLLQREIDGAPIHYLDSANTSQKPTEVLDAMETFAETSYAPINRSAYRLAADATDAFERARAKVARFVNARHPDEIVFTKNATEALNLVAQSWGGAHLAAGDVVVVTAMEHHANVVPWHIVAARQGIELRWVPLTEDGQLDLGDGKLERLLDGAKVFAFTAMSNVLGTLTPVAELSAAAHAAGALAVVDACQYVPHNVTDVQAWDADFIAFSAHKMCGPSGIGALWGRAELLDDTPPFLGGGNMIADVRFDGYTPAPVPAKFEAGTPPILEAIGFGAAVDFMQSVGMERVHTHERALTEYALSVLPERFGDELRIHGPRNPALRGGVLSFSFRDLHPHDVSQVLDQRNVCVRAGHHCAKPLMQVLDVAATVRASWYLYNDRDDIDALAEALDGASDIFGLPGLPT
jgi:cysteine desulfurase / selenocysteine lyase